MGSRYEGKYRIRTTRLQSKSYACNKTYFVTICTDRRQCYLGKISEHGIMELSQIGLFAKQCWEAIPEHFPFVFLDEFVIMPNHIHGMFAFRKPTLSQEEQTPGNQFQPQKQNLASVIGSFKSVVTKYANKNGIPFGWQSRYYEHIVREQESRENIRSYIRNNPFHWANDDLRI